MTEQTLTTPAFASLANMAGYRWGMTDNLILTLWDEETGNYWRANQRMVRDILRKARMPIWGTLRQTQMLMMPIPVWGKHDPLTRSKVVFDAVDIEIWPSVLAEYVGSIHVTDSAKSSRHFVMVEILSVTDKLRDDLGLFQLNLSLDLIPQLGHYQAPIVGRIIMQHQERKQKIEEIEQLEEPTNEDTQAA